MRLRGNTVRCHRTARRPQTTHEGESVSGLRPVDGGELAASLALCKDMLGFNELIC